MRLFMKYMKLSFKRSMQYRLNFMLTCISVAPIHLLQLLFSWFIAKKFQGFGSWSGWNLIFLYGVLLTSYSIAQIFCRRLRYLEEDVINGGLDVYFTKPLQVLSSIILNDLRIMEIFAQFLPSVIVLAAACIFNPIQWNPAKILVLIGAVLGGAVIQMAIFLLIGSVSFWTMQSSKLEDIFFVLKDFLNYPLFMYGKEIVTFLTCVFPLAFINYYPSLFILQREDSGNLLNFLTVPVAIVLAVFALLVWKVSLKHYNSTGS